MACRGSSCRARTCGDPAHLYASANFCLTARNLPHVIHTLETTHPGSHERWVEHVSEALPDVAQVTTRERPEDRHRYLVLHYRSGLSGLEAPSWLVSDGTLRLLALTLLAYLQDLTGLFLIEEPENGIHPRALETVLQSLSSVYRAQILLATHSPLVVRLADRDQLLCLARNEQGGHGYRRRDGAPRAAGLAGDRRSGHVAGRRRARMIDLFCLVADKNMEAAVSGLLDRPESLGIRRIERQVVIHDRRDPGCFHDAPDYSRRSGLLTTHRTTCGAIAPGQSMRW